MFTLTFPGIPVFTFVYTALMFKLTGLICLVLFFTDWRHDFSKHTVAFPCRCYRYEEVRYSVGEFFRWTLPAAFLVPWIIVLIYKSFSF